MLKSVAHAYSFGLEYTKMLVADIPDAQMCDQPAGIRNHPTWTLGHLCVASDFAALLLGEGMNSPEGWAQLFGRGSMPVGDAAKYPSRDVLLQALENQHARVHEALINADPHLFVQPTPDEEFRSVMPTIGNAVTFLLTSHEASHHGQLSAWRQAMGLSSVLG